jgi:hypothetical protein
MEVAVAVHQAQVAGAEPAVAERGLIGPVVVEVSRKHGRAGDADFTLLTEGNVAAVFPGDG